MALPITSALTSESSARVTACLGIFIVSTLTHIVKFMTEYLTADRYKECCVHWSALLTSFGNGGRDNLGRIVLLRSMFEFELLVWDTSRRTSGG